MILRKTSSPIPKSQPEPSDSLELDLCNSRRRSLERNLRSSSRTVIESLCSGACLVGYRERGMGTSRGRGEHSCTEGEAEGAGSQQELGAVGWQMLSTELNSSLNLSACLDTMPDIGLAALLKLSGSMPDSSHESSEEK